MSRTLLAAAVLGLALAPTRGAAEPRSAALRVEVRVVRPLSLEVTASAAGPVVTVRAPDGAVWTAPISGASAAGIEAAPARARVAGYTVVTVFPDGLRSR